MKNPFEFKGEAARNREQSERETSEWLDEKPSKIITEREIGPSPEETRLIMTVQLLVDQYIRKYGGKPNYVSPEKIHLLSPKDLAESCNELGTSSQDGILYGYCICENQRVAIGRTKSRLQLALVAAHEFFHLKSPKIVRSEGNKLYVDQKGVSLRTQERAYLVRLEEAIVAESEQQFCDEQLRPHPFLRQESGQVKLINKWVRKMLSERKALPETIDRLSEIVEAANVDRIAEYLSSDVSDQEKMAYLSIELENQYVKGDILLKSRRRHREWLYGIIDRLLAASRGQFKDRKEVFEYFARANFSGNLWPLISMVEKTLGEGEFRRMFAADSEPIRFQEIPAGSERELRPAELRKKLRDPGFLPTHEQIKEAFKDEPERWQKWQEFCDDDPNDPVYEFLNAEYVDALADYFVDRARDFNSNPKKPMIILEIGAGNGRLAHFLRQKLVKKAPGVIKVIATDSGSFKINNKFPVERLNHDEALKKYNPDAVVFSWMPYKRDYTKNIRKIDNVKEYLLIGEPDGGACGDAWETWGTGYRGKGVSAPYQADGFVREDLRHLSALQISRIDPPGAGFHSKSVSFRRKEKK